MTNSQDTTNPHSTDSVTQDFLCEGNTDIRKLFLSTCQASGELSSEAVKSAAWNSLAGYMLHESEEELKLCASETPEIYAEVLRGLLSALKSKQKDVDVLFECYARMRSVHDGLTADPEQHLAS